jgi:hypothetical protein
LASKNYVKVKNERFSLGFTVGQGRLIANPKYPPLIQKGFAHAMGMTEGGVVGAVRHH